MEQSTTLSIAYFNELVVHETKNLQSLCMKWKWHKEEHSISDEILGDIDVVSGQSELLVKERFSQFKGLIHNCEFDTGEQKVTLEDLDGFWELIFVQIANLKSNFGKLEVLRKNNWVLPSKTVTTTIKQKRKPLILKNGNVSGKSTMAPTKAKSSIREHILAAKRKMIDEKREHVSEKLVPMVDMCSISSKENMDLSSPPAENDVNDKKYFDAVFFKVETPIKKLSMVSTPKRTVLTPVGTPQLLSSTGLKNRMRLNPVAQKDYSPCMRITRAAKRKAEVPFNFDC